MKLKTERKALAKAATAVAKASSNRTTMPILGHILLTAKDDYLMLSATDLDIGVQLQIPATVKEEGQTTVPAKTFVDLVNVSGNGESVNLQLLKKGQTLKMMFGKMTSKINGLDPEDFPPMGGEYKGGVEFQVEDLRDLIAKTALSASKDQTRPVLEGVYFEFGEKELTMASADGFRLSKVTAPLPEFANGDAPVGSVILRAKALKQLQVLLGKRETVTMYADPEESKVSFVSGDLQMAITRIDGTFPDFDGIIPKDHDVSATFPTESMLKSAKAAKVFAQDAGNLVKINLDGKVIEVSSKDRETGSNETTIKPDQIEGEELAIGFNVGMLIDFLSIKNGGEMVIFESSGKSSPGVFRYQGSPDFLHIIMPMHLR